MAASSSIAVVTFNVVPLRNDSAKYERLGPIAVAALRRYCATHGYAFFGDPPAPSRRPPCWGKIPALLRALERHRWALWADSDAIVFAPWRRVEPFCDERYDVIGECPRRIFELVGRDVESGLQAMPINTGVFLVQSTAWARALLRCAYEQEQFVAEEELWNGIGDQEALASVIARDAAARRRIGYVQGLQSHPRFRARDDLFVHFYGNLASHLIPPCEAEAVIRRWEQAGERAAAFPTDLARFHWCCIQNKAPAPSVDRGGPERFLYSSSDLEPAP